MKTTSYAGIFTVVRQLLQRIPASTPSERMTRAMVEVIYSCGIRPCELLAMNIADVDFDQKVARVRREGCRERFVPLGKTAIVHLKTYLARVRSVRVRKLREAALWLNCNGERLSTRSLQRLFKRNLPRMKGKRLTPDSLRMLSYFSGMWSPAFRPTPNWATLNTPYYVKLTMSDLKKAKLGALDPAACSK